MLQKTITQSVDLSQQDGRDQLICPNVLAVKGEAYGHLWRVVITDKGLPADLTGYTASCYVINGVNTTLLEATKQDNVASVSFPSPCYAEEGEMKCLMSLHGSGQTPTVALLRLRVMDSITDVLIDPNDIIPNVADLMEIVTTLSGVAESEDARAAAELVRSGAETQRVSAESARNSAEQARATAEALRQSAETLRASAESARQTAEGGRVSAESIRQTAETARSSAETQRASATSTALTESASATAAANTAAGAANTAANNAQGMADRAENAAAALEGMTATATTRGALYPATAEVAKDPTDGHYILNIGVPKGDTGARGSLTYSGDAITGTSFVPTVYIYTGIADAKQYDRYRYNGTNAADVGNEYVCTYPGNANTAKWKFDGNVRGAPGTGNVNSVDALTPDGNGAVALGAVRYSAAQSLSDAQKTQARANVGAAKVATSPTAGHVATVDASGNPMDSGYTPEELAATLPAVRFDIDQTGSYDATAKARARANMGAQATLTPGTDYRTGVTDTTSTLTAAGWVGTAAPYTQTVTVTGLLAASKGVEAGLADSATLVQRAAARSALLMATGCSDGTVTITADGDKPTIDIPILIRRDS